MTDPISLNFHWQLPSPAYLNQVFDYFESKVRDPRYRVIAIGEEHGGGGHDNLMPRCVRTFVADAIARLHSRSPSGTVLQQRPRALALELDEDECRIPFSDFRAPDTVCVRVRERGGTYSTQRMSVVNRRALWLATENREASLIFRELLLKLAVSVPDEQLLIRGIDGDGRRRDRLPTSLQLARFDGSAWLETDRGIVRDYLMLTRLNQLISDMASRDQEAYQHGKVVMLLGSLHVHKIPAWEEMPQSIPDPDLSEKGGYYPLGYFARQGSIRGTSSSGNVVSVTGEGYCALRCLIEGTTLRQTSLDLTGYRVPNEPRSGIYDDRYPPSWESSGYSVVYSRETREYAITRAYDLISGVYFAFNAGIDVEALEKSLVNVDQNSSSGAARAYTNYPLTPPRVRHQGGFAAMADYIPLRSVFDGFLYFRRMSSWYPLGDPFYGINVAPETREAPSLYLVPGIDSESVPSWEARWSVIEPHLRGPDPLLAPGVFGDQHSEDSSVSVPLSAHEYARFFYRRISFAFVPPPGTLSGARVMLVGYGFLPRAAETLPLRIEVGNRGSPWVDGTNIRTLSDGLALFTMPSFSGVAPSIVRVSFPGRYVDGRRMEAMLIDAFGTSR